MERERINSSLEEAEARTLELITHSYSFSAHMPSESLSRDHREECLSADCSRVLQSLYLFMPLQLCTHSEAAKTNEEVEQDGRHLRPAEEKRYFTQQQMHSGTARISDQSKTAVNQMTAGGTEDRQPISLRTQCETGKKRRTVVTDSNPASRAEPWHTLPGYSGRTSP